MEATDPAAGPALGGERWSRIYGQSLDCVHCGLCLETCPTYRVTGRETSSPRGRIYLMRGAVEGRIPVGEALRDEAYLCLGCRACETACPSGVEFGSMLELARAEIQDAGLRRGFAARLERWLLRGLVPHRRRLRWVLDLLFACQRLGFDRVARRLLPARHREMLDLMPRVPPRRDRAALPREVAAQGERRGRVAFFVGCIMPELFGAANAATVRVLARNGFDVVIPEAQGCCGALQAHGGDADTAAKLSRINLAAFADLEVDAIITNSAGCGATLREMNARLGGEPEAESLAASVRDVTEFLDEVGLRDPPRRIEASVCYDDACHLVHAQRVDAAPRRLLARIPGLRLLEHDDPGACCGAAGIYNLTQRAMSQAVLAPKLKSLAAADPDIIASGNPGCLMQLSTGVRSAGLRARVMHTIELLDESYSDLTPLA